MHTMQSYYSRERKKSKQSLPRKRCIPFPRLFLRESVMTIFARAFPRNTIVWKWGDCLQENRERPALLVWALRLFLLLAVFGLLAGPLTLPVQAVQTVRAGETGGQTRYVIPLGRAVGIKLFSDGVLVVGLSEVPTDTGLTSPARVCGLKEGDVITRINDEPVRSIQEVQTILQELDGAEMQVSYLRDEAAGEVTARAVQCSTDGAYKLGAWIRDSMAGIGTLTFAEPETGLFGTLGHGVNDVDTAVLMKLQTGAITPATVAGVVKGVSGRPGELRGSFTAGKDLGTLYANTERGVFGHLTDGSLLTGQPMAVAEPEEVHTGPAVIRTNISGDRVEEYAVEITDVDPHSGDTRDMMLRVTDEKLLERTGGIVQGMSGSPILQDGKLVGAVTHVLVDRADRGYGIFATHMLEAAEEAAAE